MATTTDPGVLAAIKAGAVDPTTGKSIVPNVSAQGIVQNSTVGQVGTGGTMAAALSPATNDYTPTNPYTSNLPQETSDYWATLQPKITQGTNAVTSAVNPYMTGKVGASLLTDVYNPATSELSNFVTGQEQKGVDWSVQQPQTLINSILAAYPDITTAPTDVQNAYNQAQQELTGVQGLNFAPAPSEASTSKAEFAKISTDAQSLSGKIKNDGDLAYSVSAMNGNESGMYEYGGDSGKAKAAGYAKIQALGMPDIQTPDDALHFLYDYDDAVSEGTATADQMANAQKIYDAVKGFATVNRQGSSGHSNLGGLWTA